MTRPHRPTRRRAKASKCACWCSFRPAPDEYVPPPAVRVGGGRAPVTRFRGSYIGSGAAAGRRSNLGPVAAPSTRDRFVPKAVFDMAPLRRRDLLAGRARPHQRHAIRGGPQNLVLRPFRWRTLTALVMPGLVQLCAGHPRKPPGFVPRRGWPGRAHGCPVQIYDDLQMLRSTSSPSAGLDPAVHVLQWRGLARKRRGCPRNKVRGLKAHGSSPATGYWCFTATAIRNRTAVGRARPSRLE